MKNLTREHQFISSVFHYIYNENSEWKYLSVFDITSSDRVVLVIILALTRHQSD